MVWDDARARSALRTLFDAAVAAADPRKVLAPHLPPRPKGLEVGIPYYLNLAPNYDLTLTPRYLQKRGTQIAEQFRFLEKHYNAELNAEQLPNDRTLDQASTTSSFASARGSWPSRTPGRPRRSSRR